MFRKIVSNLAFSPSLVGQLSFYARRLRKEEFTRRVGLVFTALALVVQSLVVFNPPEAANAASGADWVRGGVSDMKEYLRHYDRNDRNIKTILTSLGITRQDLTKTKQTVIGEASRYNWSMTSLYSHAQGQRAYSYKKPGGGTGKVFYRPMRLTQQGGDRHVVFAGYSAKQGWFAVKKDCGNLITAKPPVKPKPAAACQNLAITRLSSTRFRFDGKASVKNGAKIKGYSFVVKKNGATISTINKNSAKAKYSTTYNQTTPGTYQVTLTVRTSVGAKTSKQSCTDQFTVSQNPFAECVAVNATLANRTMVSLTGAARAQNGAKITTYRFVVKNAAGTVVKQVQVASSAETVTAPSFELTQPGSYTVHLTVATSLGDKTAANCQKPFTIAKPEVCPYKPSLPPNHPDCQPCPDNPEIWIKDEKCAASMISSKTGVNLTQGNVDATTKTAKADDKIAYTITVENTGYAADSIAMTESLGDVLEYARLIDNGGGSYNQRTKELSWGNVNVKAGQKESRTFVVQLLSPLPSTNTGVSDEASYDCVMTNTFGNAVEVKVDCAVTKKIVERTVEELPHTGPKENMLFAGILLSVVTFFYARSRQLSKEVRLVRRDLHTGTI